MVETPLDPCLWLKVHILSTVDFLDKIKAPDPRARGRQLLTMGLGSSSHEGNRSHRGRRCASVLGTWQAAAAVAPRQAVRQSGLQQEQWARSKIQRSQGASQMATAHNVSICKMGPTLISKGYCEDLGAPKITADGDCSQEIKRRLLLGRKVMTNVDSILKSRDITLPTKVCLVKASQGNPSWMFTGRTDVEAEAAVLWPLCSESLHRAARATHFLKSKGSVSCWFFFFFFFFFLKFYFIFKLYITVLVLPNIKMNLPQVYVLVLISDPEWRRRPAKGQFSKGR